MKTSNRSREKRADPTWHWRMPFIHFEQTFPFGAAICRLSSRRGMQIHTLFFVRNQQFISTVHLLVLSRAELWTEWFTSLVPNLENHFLGRRTGQIYYFFKFIRKKLSAPSYFINLWICMFMIFYLYLLGHSNLTRFWILLMYSLGHVSYAIVILDLVFLYSWRQKKSSKR